MGRNRNEQVVLECLVVLEAQCSVLHIDCRQGMEGVEADALGLKHLLHRVPELGTGDRHRLRLRREQMHLAFHGQLAFSQVIGDEHRAFMRRARTFVGHRGDGYRNFPAGES
jgi:hypothetical protein